MPFSEFLHDSPAPLEADHETYIRWATDFGLIEWVVGEDGEVYFVAASCEHACKHTEESCDEPSGAVVPAHRYTKKPNVSRVLTAASVAALATVGLHQMSVAAAPTTTFYATTGETLVIHGDHVEILPDEHIDPVVVKRRHALPRSGEIAVAVPCRAEEARERKAQRQAKKTVPAVAKVVKERTPEIRKAKAEKPSTVSALGLYKKGVPATLPKAVERAHLNPAVAAVYVAKHAAKAHPKGLAKGLTVRA